MRVRSRLAGDFLLSYRDPRSRRLDWTRQFPNGVTVEGVNYLLNAGHRGGAQQALWYVGLIDNSGFSSLSSADTHAAHPGWAEFTSVFGGSRAAWTPTAANGGAVTDPAPASITVTANGTVRGALLASRQAVGTSSGAVLYATGAMGTGLAVTAGGILTVSYTARLQEV